MSSIQISELNPNSMIELNSSETQEVLGGRGRGRRRFRSLYNFFNNQLNYQQATNFAFVINYGDNSPIYISQSINQDSSQGIYLEVV